MDNIQNQPSKFRTKNWVEIDCDSCGTSSTNSQIKSKTSILKSTLFDYSDACILVKQTVTVSNTASAGPTGTNANKKVKFKNCTPFTGCITEINNTLAGNAKNLDVVMPMYNLTEYGDNYLKTLGSLHQYYRVEQNLKNASTIIDFSDADNNSASFKLK